MFSTPSGRPHSSPMYVRKFGASHAPRHQHSANAPGAICVRSAAKSTCPALSSALRASSETPGMSRVLPSQLTDGATKTWSPSASPCPATVGMRHGKFFT